MSVLSVVDSEVWAIRQESLETIRAIASRDNLDPEAVSAKLGRPLDNTRSVTMRDGVAIIPMAGPIFRYANLFTEISGAVSLEVLATEFRAALDDPSVKAILLEVDSPGGQINGLADFASQIYAARGIKPVTAYVSGDGCSAAYWLASAASEVVASATSEIGSIGVISRMPGSKPTDDIQFVSSVSPNKRPDPQTASGLAQVQSVVDALGDVFVEAVAKYRGISVQEVLAKYGQGGLFVGAGAVEAGLADRLGTFEGTLAGLSGTSQGGKVMAKSYAEALAAGEVMPITANELTTNCAALVTDIQAKATEGMTPSADVEANQTKAVEAESARFMGLAKAVCGEASAAKLEQVAATGCTAEQAQALALALGGGAPAQDGDEAGAGNEQSKRQAALAAITAAGADTLGTKAGGKPQAEGDEPGDFKALVATHRKENKDCSLADAQKAVAEEHPEAHQAYLDDFNQTQTGK